MNSVRTSTEKKWHGNCKKEKVKIEEYRTEMKNNLQGLNSRVDAVENQISNLEYKKQKTPEQNSKRKKNPKKIRIVQGPSGTTSSTQTFPLQGCWKEKRVRNWKSTLKNDRKLP